MQPRREMCRNAAKCKQTSVHYVKLKFNREMTSLRDIFSSTYENRAKTRSRSKTRPVPPLATLEPSPKPQWNRNKPQQKPISRSSIIPQTKPPAKLKAVPHAHAPDGAEFHQRRSKFVQCRNQSSQTMDEPDGVVPQLQALIIAEKEFNPPEKKEVSERSTVRYKKPKKPVKPVEIDPNCPVGHVALTDAEKNEMKSNLEKLYAESLCELNRLPICVDTLRVRTRRIELEKLLQETEDKIKLTSKTKVYVPV